MIYNIMKYVKTQKSHKIKINLLITIIILLSIYVIRFSTIFDEDYSLELIHNNFLSIIKIDSLDVHPPLFYFLLKIFIDTTTFWTSSFLIKVIFARIFSVIVSLLTFIFLIKICKILEIENSIFSQWLLFLITPGVISFTYEFIKIRMYALGGLFVVIEFYELIRFNKLNKQSSLIFVTISCILSVYTNYYSGLISGLILLSYLIISIIHHRRNWVRLITSGIIVIISFIPWMPILFKQWSIKYSHGQNGFLIQCLATIIFIILLSYPLLWSYKYLNNCFNIFFIISFITLISLFIFMTLLSIIGRQSIFQFRYFYPIFIIYGFLSLNIMLLIIKHRQRYLIWYGSIILIIMMSLISVGSYLDQIRYYNLSSNAVCMLKNLHNWPHYHKIIYLKSVNNPDQGFNLEKAIYLSQMNKKFYAPKNIGLIYKMKSYKALYKPIANHTIDLKYIKR